MRRGLILLAALSCALFAAAPAGASPTQQMLLMDDNELVFGTDEEVEATFGAVRALGVDTVRVDLLWHLVAPSSENTQKPAFDAANPAAYPQGQWDIYDRVVNAAARNGIGVLFTITGPVPVWATSDPARGDKSLNPNAGEFRDFVTAVGTRYSGSYLDEQPEQAPAPGGLPFLPPPPAPPGPTPLLLPRVSTWSAWNEPNQPGWLRPQAVNGRPVSPHIYRGLQDAAYAGLAASGHGDDTYLLAETAPRGSQTVTEQSPMRPLLFIRELYCVNRRLRPFRGAAATARGCPADAAARRRFAEDHPGLFQASAFAHHPYALEVAPAARDPIRDNITLAVLPRLTKTLDRIFRRHGVRRRLPVWITEYGYQTDPPDPLIGVSWPRQAAYINEAEYMAFRYRRVRAMTQFLLVDDGPNRDWPESDPRYWGSTFQTGLVALDGRRKDAYDAFALPVHVTPRRQRRGRRLTVWGGNRPARAAARLSATVEFRRRGSSRWRTVRRLTTRSRRGYVLARVRARASGDYRLAWEAGRSRAVSVRVERRLNRARVAARTPRAAASRRPTRPRPRSRARPARARGSGTSRRSRARRSAARAGAPGPARPRHPRSTRPRRPRSPRSGGSR